jgi:sec-independent protein translocase protein TatA
MGPEWIVVLIVAIVVIFGVNKLPQIARNVGKAQTEFKKGLKEGASASDEEEESTKPAEKPPASDS